MQPAFSVIFLTTLIGMGQGVFLAIYTEHVYSVLNVVQQSNNSQFYVIGSVVALGLLVLGLFASFFHLGHPERAWRAATMWRTSWLSREVIVLPIVMFFVFVYAVLHFFEFNIVLITFGSIDVNLSLVIGAVATLTVFALYICTAMIYASLKFLQEWHCVLTVLNYTLLGSASGFTATALLSFYTQADKFNFYLGWSLVLLVLAFISRIASLYRNRRLRPISTVQTAIGIRHNQIKQKSMGFMGGAVNTRDFFHGKTRLFIRSIKQIFIWLLFIVPLCIMTLTFYSPSYEMIGLAMISMYLGLLAERWYFFADANHPQNIYYQVIS
ncbi:MAG: dimethyl sulfoxide reductase anchor subunit [Gammaproteobacteria bacterium]|nr:dimethyl sulfoxide reductase anchor subunit [Gammaproteobacteria bacterium]